MYPFLVRRSVYWYTIHKNHKHSDATELNEAPRQECRALPKSSRTRNRQVYRTALVNKLGHTDFKSLPFEFPPILNSIRISPHLPVHYHRSKSNNKAQSSHSHYGNGHNLSRSTRLFWMDYCTAGASTRL